MAFPCPACQAPVEADLDRWLVRCTSCGGRLRSRRVETGGEARVYEVEVSRRPSTRRRVEVEWSARERRRLSRWLLWSSVITLSLVAVLYALARWGS